MFDRLLDIRVFSDPLTLKILVYLIGNSNDGKVKTSVRKLPEVLNMTYQQIRTRLNYLAESGFINAETNALSNAQNSVITLCESYGLERKPESSVTQVSTHKTTHPETIDYERFCNFFNEKVSSGRIPQITKLTAKRKMAVEARLRDYGKEALSKAIIKASKSKFLNGDNNTQFIASFDWIFGPMNFPKVLEGNYDNR